VRRAFFIGAFLALTGVAWAGDQKPTFLSVDDYGIRSTIGGDYAYALGRIDSPKPKCVDGRKVVFSVFYAASEERDRFDVDVTDDDGGFAGYGRIQTAPIDRIQVKVPKAKAGKATCALVVFNSA
jgi:hypothetical protein